MTKMFVSLIILLLITSVHYSIQNFTVEFKETIRSTIVPNENKCTKIARNENKGVLGTSGTTTPKNNLQQKYAPFLEVPEKNYNTEYKHIPHVKRNLNFAEEGPIGSNYTIAKFDEKNRNRQRTYSRTIPEEHPWAMLIIIPDKIWIDGTICHGTLVKSEWVVSASACFLRENAKLDTSNYVKVFGGASYERDAINMRFKQGRDQMREVHSWYFRPQDDSRINNQYTIALLKVDHPFDLTRYVSPVFIDFEPWKEQLRQYCHITTFGWVYGSLGADDDDRYRKTYRMEIEPCGCHKFKWQFQPKYGFQLCGVVQKEYGQGLCGGDEGAGLVCNGRLRGVLVHLETVKNLEKCDLTSVNTKCGSRYTANVFKQSNYLIQWISSLSVSQAKNKGRIVNQTSFSSCLLVVMILFLNELQ